MKVMLTGWNGFLAKKLREDTSIEWSQGLHGSDALLILGGPVFTQPEINKLQSQIVHQYVQNIIRLLSSWKGYVIFASTTGVNDIDLLHKGSTSYNLSKLYLENYIVHHVDKYLILRIGNIISDSQDDIRAMKSDRIQPRIRQNDFTNIPIVDEYLMVDQFVKTTVDAISKQRTGILEYESVTMKLSQLIKVTKGD